MRKQLAAGSAADGEYVRQAAMLKFLDLLCKELGAEDARAEIGGRAPDDAHAVWVETDAGFRLVALFAAPPADRAAKQARLEHLIAGFSQSLREVPMPVPPSTPPDSPFKRLDQALETLRSRTGGVGVVVIDAHSPVLWGSSEPQRHADDVSTLVQIGEALQAVLEAGAVLDAICALQPDDVPARLRELGIAADHGAALARVLAQHNDETALRHHLLTCLAVARARSAARPTHESTRLAHHETQFGFFVRGFANIYSLVIVFEGAFSELYVESAVVHALPGVEHLLLALPPLDPGPGAKGGRVIRLRR